jgi:hypothetical protein
MLAKITKKVHKSGQDGINFLTLPCPPANVRFVVADFLKLEKNDRGNCIG